MVNLKELEQFIKKISNLNLYKFEIKTEDFEIKIQTSPEVKLSATAHPVQQQIPIPVQHSSASVEPQKTEKSQETSEQKENQDKNLYTIKAPMVGTFYRRPAPDKPPYVEVGSHIKKGDIVCIIEAMKIFNEIEAEVEGEIVKVLVEDATPVEYDQPLFLVKLD